ncbi:MAG: proprotein convertase P-domain-containing protein, partial [Saprospiraceae bacterium]
MTRKFKPYLYILILFISFININYTFSQGCNYPSNIGKKEISDNYIIIKWALNSNADHYKIEWRKINENYSSTTTIDSIYTNEIKIIGLESGTQYYYKLKSICSDEESNWSNEYSFITNFNNPTDCNLNFTLKDGNEYSGPGKTYFYINNYEFPESKLGINVFIQNIKIIIDHSWPHDLIINLTSPSGKKIQLFQTNQLQNNSIGNSTDTLCNESMNLSDEACQNLSEEVDNYIGNFIPFEPITMLYDSTSPVGTWELEVIDQIDFNVGKLKFFEIDFEPIICPMPQNISV